MQGSSAILRTPKATRVRNDQFDIKQERRRNERSRQEVRASHRQAKQRGE